jgi:poly(A) polymerase Pap1
MLIFKSIFLISIIQLAHAFKSAFKINQNCLSQTEYSHVDVVNRIKVDNGRKGTDKKKIFKLNLIDGIMTGYDALTYSFVGGIPTYAVSID